MPDDDRPQRARRVAAVRRQAELCALPAPIERSLVAFDPGRPGAPGGLSEELAAGSRTTLMLAAACIQAAALGIERVVWPIHVGGHQEGSLNVDEMMDLCDRALLVSQLVSLDAPRTTGRMGVRIQTPYVDFTDAQMMDLALDMDAPLAACWWCLNDQPEPCGHCGPCLRWRRALAAVDPVQSLRLEDLARQQQATA
jgi:7-cyano-7-deazaguanine synthase in queuosine biosynthesis